MAGGLRACATAAAIGLLLQAGPAAAQPRLEELAREDENPLARFVRVQVENNVQFGFGPDRRPLNVLRIQPVFPVELAPDWSLIARTVVPIVHQPWPETADGLSDILLQILLSPPPSESFAWGLGPSFVLASASDDIIGAGKWSAGPVGIGVLSTGPWVVGAIVSNLWSFAGDTDRPDVNVLTIRPLVNYNLAHGWYLTSSPTILANWEAERGERWLVPLGGGVAKVFPIAGQSLSVSLEGFYHVASPEIGPRWQLRLQLTLLFPR